MPTCCSWSCYCSAVYLIPSAQNGHGCQPATKIFVEVANSIKISHGAGAAGAAGASTQLMFLSAPFLQAMPEQLKVDPHFPFAFDPVDFHPEVAANTACDFAIAGAALLLRQRLQRLVGWQDDAVFKFLPDGSIVAGDHVRLLQELSGEVNEAAQRALQDAWLRGIGVEADREPPVLSKATVMAFLTFLANWTRNWAFHAFHFEQQLEGVSGVDIHGTFVPVLKAMIGMAAAMCLRSSAAEAQEQQQAHKTFRTSEDQRAASPASLSEAMAARVVDGRTSASTVWAFNTGGSLRFIGNSSEVPAALKHLWKTARDQTRQAFPEPLTNLGIASQENLRSLLLEVMSGHGLTPEELKETFKGFVLTRDNMIKLVDVAERLRAKLLCILMGEAGCGKTVPWLCFRRFSFH